MPATYTGYSDAVESHQPVEIQCPVDADAFGASAINSPLQQLANIVAYLQEHAALRGGLEAAVFEGLPGDTNAALQLPGVIVDQRKLEIEAGQKYLAKTRLYVQPSGGLEITTNACWDGTNWVRDQSWSSSRLLIGPDVIELATHPATGASPWADSAWVTKAQFATDDRIRFTGTTETPSGSNPESIVPITNELRAKNVCKAWGVIGLGATPSVKDGFNVDSVSLAGGLIRVVFASPMASPDYAIQITLNRITNAWASIMNRSATGFDIELYGSGGMVDTSGFSSADDIMFSVYGRQES